MIKSHIWAPLQPRERKAVLWVLGLLAFYAIAGFLILPPIVRHIAARQISRQLGRDVSIEAVRINPFALSTMVRGLKIMDLDGKPLVSWDEVYVNFQLSSFLGHPWVFKEISLSKPYVRVEMNKDSTFNFSDIVGRFATNSSSAGEEPRPAKPIALRIGRLHIAGAQAALADFTPSEPFQRRVGPLDITLMNFHTDPANKNPYAFTGATDAGETISWSGFFYLTPLRSEGELKLYNFALNKYAPLYQDMVRFQVRDGSINLSLGYHLELSASNRIAELHDLAYSLRDFKVGFPDKTNNILDVPLFSLTGGEVNLQKHVATLDSVQLTGAKAFLSRDTNAAINVVEMSQPAESSTNAPGGLLFLLHSITNAVATLLNSTNQWTGTVRAISATNCELHLEDYAHVRPAKLDLSGITLEAGNLSNLADTNLYAEFSLRWNTNGTIHIGADVAFQPTTADIKVDLNQLDLSTLDACLADKLDICLLNSEVNLHGKVRLRPQVNDVPVVSFIGDGSLDHFHAVAGEFGEDLLKWDAVRFNGIVANLNPPLVALGEVVVDNACVRAIVETNRTLNLANVLKPLNVSTPVTNGTKTAAGGTPSARSSINLPVHLSIGAIIFTNTAVNFSDYSLPHSVNISLRSLNGAVSGISSEQLRHADVDLSAKADGTGPVSISGIINPLNGAQTNDIKITLKDMDLAPASPYAGKFAGYGIARGKLNLDLNYQLIGRNLVAKNVVTLDQFTFGEQVNSPDATHLPVRLAVAIMKDRDGKIVLDVPVEGSLDDPKFRIGKVVTRTLENILEKVATSPFSLVGAMFGGGGEELAWEDFAPGSAELTDADRKKLDTITRALIARPGLHLGITGSIDPDGDREGLQRAALDRDIRQQLWNKLRRSEKSKTSPEQITVKPEERARYIQKMSTAAFAAGKITREMIAANTNLELYAEQAAARVPAFRKGAELLIDHKPAATSVSVRPSSKLVPPPEPLEALLMATYSVTETDFQALAMHRAQAVQEYLIQTGKADAGRVFNLSGQSTTTQRGSRAYLELR